MTKWIFPALMIFTSACTQETMATRDDPTSSASTAPTSASSAVCTPIGGDVDRPSAWRDLEFSDADAWAYGARVGHSAVWDGREMLVYGGGTPVAAAFDPSLGRWSKLPDGPLGPRTSHVAAWIGGAMLVVGGVDDAGAPRAEGALYDPCASSWRSIADAPVTWSSGVSAAWSTATRELLVVGAPGGDVAYSPEKNAWRAIAPTPLASRAGAKIAWTGTKLLVVDDGAATYDPALDAWTTIGSPPMTAKIPDVVVVDGARALFFGGATSGAPARDGAMWDESTDAWASIVAPPEDVLSPRLGAIAFAADDRLVVFGGHTFTDDRYIHTANDGAIYDPSAAAWTHLDGQSASYAMREEATVVWTGRDAIVLGGAASCVMCNPRPPGGEAYRP